MLSSNQIELCTPQTRWSLIQIVSVLRFEIFANVFIFLRICVDYNQFYIQSVGIHWFKLDKKKQNEKKKQQTAMAFLLETIWYAMWQKWINRHFLSVLPSSACYLLACGTFFYNPPVCVYIYIFHSNWTIDKNWN